MPGDFDGFLFIFYVKKKIAADRLLGFGERTVDDGATAFARYKLPFISKGMARGCSSLLGQPLEPVVPLVHYNLHALWGKAFVPVRATEQQHVVELGSIGAHRVVFLQVSSILAPLAMGAADAGEEAKK